MVFISRSRLHKMPGVGCTPGETDSRRLSSLSWNGLAHETSVYAPGAEVLRWRTTRNVPAVAKTGADRKKTAPLPAFLIPGDARQPGETAGHPV